MTNWGWFQNFRYSKNSIVGLATVTLPAGSSNIVRAFERVCSDSLPRKQNSFLSFFVRTSLLSPFCVYVKLFFICLSFSVPCSYLCWIPSSCRSLVVAYFLLFFGLSIWSLICFKDCPPHVKYRAFGILLAKINIPMVWCHLLDFNLQQPWWCHSRR